MSHVFRITVIKVSQLSVRALPILTVLERLSHTLKLLGHPTRQIMQPHGKNDRAALRAAGHTDAH